MEKGKGISLAKKKLKKYKMHDLTNMKTINIHHPCAKFIINNNSSLVFTVWKWGENDSTTSLLLIDTSNNWWFPDKSVFISSGDSLCSNE